MPFSYIFLLALFLTVILTVAKIAPAGAPALLLCYPLGLSMALCALDTLIAVIDRDLPAALWMLLWTVLLLILTSACLLIVIWSSFPD